MNETGGRFPHSLAEYVGTRTGTNGAQSTLVLRMPKGRGQPFFLEPKIQQTPGILPVSPKVVRKIAIDIYEALTVLHSVGYVHGAVNTESLVWNRREAVLARYRRMASDPDGRQGAIDVADAARLLYHVAIGRPLNGDTLPPATSGNSTVDCSAWVTSSPLRSTSRSGASAPPKPGHGPPASCQ